MKNSFKGTKTIVFFVALILSSCASHPGKVDCPSFNSSKSLKSKKIKTGLKHQHFRLAHSFKKKQKLKNKKNFQTVEKVELFSDFEETHQNTTASIENHHPFIFATEPALRAIELKHKEPTTRAMNNVEIQKTKSVTAVPFKGTKTYHREIEKNRSVPEKNSDDDIQLKSQRKTARVIGGALLLMAVLSAISIPALGTLTASIGLVGIFLLDILVSFCIYKYHKKDKPKLAKTSSLLRLLYTGIFGAGVSYHLAGNVLLFTKLWGVGLIAFGIHLISMGILFNNEGGKKWVNILIKSLLIIAGIGYIIQYVGILVVPNPAGFAILIESIFIVPMILGEVLYALWMLFRGGRNREI